MKALPSPLSSRAQPTRGREWKINDRLSVSAREGRVPHISRVFREMRDTTALDVQL